jgi:hypothetical protein
VRLPAGEVPSEQLKWFLWAIYSLSCPSTSVSAECRERWLSAFQKFVWGHPKRRRRYAFRGCRSRPPTEIKEDGGQRGTRGCDRVGDRILDRLRPRAGRWGKRDGMDGGDSFGYFSRTASDRRLRACTGGWIINTGSAFLALQHSMTDGHRRISVTFRASEKSQSAARAE